jgi:uncharacterized protein YneF (UPF0154 family)
MPYHIVKAPSGGILRGYYVVNDLTSQRMSKNPLPYKSAVAQLRALYANLGKERIPPDYFIR